jgi:crotonobetainyl-CoA:carnitine CoA-transferase CaiB-like acyl-CoA transferase
MEEKHMGMLDDVKVLDFCTNAAGPVASAEMADYGAQVIKIESMGGGPERTYVPILEGKSLTHAWVNRGKKSITLNLKDPRGVEIVKKLAKDADVLVESNRPGVMDRLGLGYKDLKEINPKLIYCSLTAFGQTGPYAQNPGFDMMGQALSGMMSITGEKGGKPLKHGIALADYFGGFNAFAAVMTALHYQRRTGKGQYIDVSLIQGMIHLNSTIDRLNDGVLCQPNGNHHSGLCPFGCFNTDKGESVIICAPSAKAWETVAAAMERPDFLTDPEYNTINARVKNMEKIIEEIEAWLSSFPSLKEACERMTQCHMPYCMVNNDQQVVEDPQVKHMGYIVQAPTADDIKQPTYQTRGCNAFFSEAPGEIRKAATLGQHNHEVLKELGYGPEEIDQMMEEFRQTLKK